MRTVAATAVIASLWCAPLLSQEERGPESLAARVQKQVSRLGSSEHSETACAELRRLGPDAVPLLARALEIEVDRGITPTTRGIVEVLASFGNDAEPARPLLERLANTGIPMRELALPALVRSRWPGGLTVAADYSQNRIVGFDGKGREVFALERVFGAFDVEMLENGNLLITEFALNRVREVDLDGKTVWQHEQLRNPYDADRLPGGNTLIANTFGNEVVEVDREGQVVWRLQVAKPYDVERLPGGNTLIADGANDRVIEVDPDGATVREITGLPSVHDVDHLEDGNLLVVQRTLHRVIEIDPDGEIVWVLEGLASPSDADRLPNGHTLVAENGRVAEYDADGTRVASTKLSWAVQVNRY